MSVEGTVVRYSKDFEAEQVRLVELPAELASEESWKDDVWIKGGLEQDVVLCAGKRTYRMAFLESSNTQLLLHDGAAGGHEDGGAPPERQTQALAECRGYVVLEKTAPRIDHLRDLLRTREFSEDDGGNAGYTFPELLSQVQASEDELRGGLLTLRAVEVDDRWYSVSRRDEEHVVSLIADTLVVLGLTAQKVQSDQIRAALNDDVCRVLLDHCLDHFFRKEADGTVSRDHRTLCRLYAAKVLHQADGAMPADPFLLSLEESVPEVFNVQPNMEELVGLVFTDAQSSSPPTVRLLDTLDLPSESVARLHALFEIKHQWTRDQLCNYIPDEDLSNVLARHSTSIRTLDAAGTCKTFYRKP